MGLVAIVLWSSSVAFIRTLAEQMGPFSTVAFSYLFAGAVTLAVTAYSKGGLPRLWSQPPKYLWGCGALFVIYTACFCLSVGLAVDRAQVLEVGLVNYLWPSLTLLLALPIQGHRAR